MKYFLNNLLLSFYFLLGIYSAIVIFFLLIIFAKRIIMSVYEFFKKNIFGFFSPVTQRWKYLSKKYWTKKESNLRELTFAKKKASKLNTYKGFYIPPKKPKEGLSLFFDKKREETENFLKNQNFSLKKKKVGKQFIFSKKTFQKKLSKKLSKKLLFLKKIYNYFLFNKYSHLSTTYKIINFSDFLWVGNLVSKWIFYCSSNNFKYKTLTFTWFKNKSFANLKNLEWFVLNWGFFTENYFTYFLILKSPIYLVSLNFIFVKFFLLKLIKTFYRNKFFLFWNNLSKKTLFFTSTLSNYLNENHLNLFFYFLSVYFNYFKNSLKKLFFKNLIFIILLKKSNSFINKFFLIQFQIFFDNLSFIKKNLKFKNWSDKTFLLLNFFSRIIGSQNFHIILTKNWKRKKEFSFEICYNLSNLSLKKIGLNYNLTLFFSKINYSFENKFINYNFINLFSAINYNFYWVIVNTKIFETPISSTFLNLCSTENKHNLLFWNKYEKTLISFINLYNYSLKIYTNINSVLNKSYSQQLDVYVKLNIINMLFKFLIKWGKKLTAWKVFINFIKWFKEKYNLPALAIFTHAVLKAEPKIWLKKKKIAGKIYEIPIFITSRRSKAIAIWWLLEYAKKWQKLDIADSLAQEIWDVCFDKGLTINARDQVHSIAKRNKAYMWWF